MAAPFRFRNSTPHGETLASSARPTTRSSQTRTKLPHGTHLFQHPRQLRHSHIFLKVSLHPVEDPHHPHRPPLTHRLQHQPKRPRILRIDSPPHQPLRLQRRDAVTHIPPSRLKRLRQFRRLDATLGLEEDRSQHQSLKERQPLLSQNLIQRSFHPSSDPARLKHWALPQKSFNPHRNSFPPSRGSVLH